MTKENSSFVLGITATAIWYFKSVSTKLRFACVISGFHREVDELCTLLGYHTAYSGYFITIIRCVISQKIAAFLLLV